MGHRDEVTSIGTRDAQSEGGMMGVLSRVVLRLSKVINVIAGIALCFMMLLTVADVFLRAFRKPIIGTYELVAYSGVIVIAFSLPFTWLKGHVCVDFLLLKFSPKNQKIIQATTRILGIVFFLLSGSYLIRMGMSLYATGEVSSTLQMPFYPLAYGAGICFFIQCLVLLCDLGKTVGGNDV
jgi:TRAP-type C4-dicarboxylate transport system permease small subunit